MYTYLLVLTASARALLFYLFLPTEPAPIPPSLTYGPCSNHRRYAALGNSAAHWLLAAARIGSYEVPAACTSTIADLSRNLGLSPLLPFSCPRSSSPPEPPSPLHRPSLFYLAFLVAVPATA